MSSGAPGVSVTSGSVAPSSSPPTDTGTWFVTGQAEKGPINEPVLILNMAAFVSQFGQRSGGITLYDAAQTFFEEGGSRLYVAREGGPAAALATAIAKNGSSENTLTINATSVGSWANGLELITTTESSKFKAQVKLGGVVVEEKAGLASNAEAVAYFANSPYIRLIDLGKGNPAAATKTLASGTDDRENITETQHEAALALFSAHLGPGQVSSPGKTTEAAQKAIAAHAKAKNRVAFLDGTDTATVGTLTSQATTLREQSTARYMALFAPWVIVPGITPGTTRTVPPCALMAGLAARNDGSGGNPNEALAGVEHLARYCTNVSQVPWSAENRTVLSEAGVNVIRQLNGVPRPYDNVTLVNPLVDNTWIQLSNARLNMAICSRAEAVAERHLFAQITTHEIAKFNGDLVAEVLLPLFDQEALFGETPEEAFQVETGEQVNTEQTISEGKLKAIIAVKMSASAERVEIEVVKEAI
jgi:phage tail sheath protein FI